MGLLLAPVRAIIVAEHWLFPKLGLTRYWSNYKGNTTNIAAFATWIVSMIVGVAVEQAGILHLFFILVPLWIFSTIMYVSLASVMGAKASYPQAAKAEAEETERKRIEATFLKSDRAQTQISIAKVPALSLTAKYISWLALVGCGVIGVSSYATNNVSMATSWMLLPTLIYFVSATYAYITTTQD